MCFYTRARISKRTPQATCHPAMALKRMSRWLFLRFHSFLGESKHAYNRLLSLWSSVGARFQSHSPRQIPKKSTKRINCHADHILKTDVPVRLSTEKAPKTEVPAQRPYKTQRKSPGGAETGVPLRTIVSVFVFI